MNKFSFSTIKINQTAVDLPSVCQATVWIDGASVREPYLLETRVTGTDISFDLADPFDRNYYFDDQIEISLQVGGESFFFDDSESVSITIDSPVYDGFYAGNHESDDGDLKVWFEYSVESDVDVDPIEAAVEEFEAGETVVDSDEFSGWRHLDHSDIVDRLESMVTESFDPEDEDHPAFEFDQGNTPYCVITAIGFVIATKFPRRFAEICRSIYETNGFLGTSDVYRGQQTLHTLPAPQRRIPGEGLVRLDDLDWLFLSTLRQATASDELTMDEDLGGYNPIQSISFTGDLIPMEDVSWVGKSMVGSQQTLMEASDAVENGGFAILAVKSDILDLDDIHDPPDDVGTWMSIGRVVSTADHDITLVSEVETIDTVDEEALTFDAHSYGSRHTIEGYWEHLNELYMFSLVGTAE
ncbi:hypothetical protein [Natrarchaeobius chitinivorans]|uniref:Uncharacterized protein n=1 Tax=Natrarchaeobius chitinivorans TaxID=1679083 RepID=A0A3N6MJ73_NATCH|nr:hypothetical protein [Natrarchaeobius chitinivorans]RQG94176.1 hypothetical protein EA473_12425 [Natrarchaeobius chitinivorans]